MIAEDIMTREPITVTERTSIAEALNVMSEHGFRHLPVVRGNDIVGMLSDRDFRQLGLTVTTDEASFQQLRARVTRPVTSLMTAGVVTVDQDADVGEIIDLLLEEQLTAVPVVESGTQELVGIVSYVDLLRATRELVEED